MLLGERRQHILAFMQNEGRALVGDLSKKLGISQITIRKDLDYLQSRGLVERTHGGALPVQAGALADPSLQEKEKQHHNEKLRIATAAVKLVQEGQCIMLDSGTTTTAVARALKKFNTLTIITNGVNIAAELTATNFEVILTGGSSCFAIMQRRKAHKLRIDIELLNDATNHAIRARRIGLQTELDRREQPQHLAEYDIHRRPVSIIDVIEGSAV